METSSTETQTNKACLIVESPTHVCKFTHLGHIDHDLDGLQLGYVVRDLIQLGKHNIDRGRSHGYRSAQRAVHPTVQIGCASLS